GLQGFDLVASRSNLHLALPLALLTGVTATSISCLSAGVVGQVFHLVATGAIGVGLTIVHNATCANGSKILTNTNATVKSVTASSTASVGFIYSGTEWIMYSANL
ncbi:MAG: hypothetical protein K2X47_01745, partial [Bdellovibrionales bacterium]|nr:hypothetical protein [Bdellovibrionales bacterium]